MDARNRITDFVRALPPAHRVVIVSALVALAMLGVVFFRWVTTPSYTVLYSDLDEKSLAGVIDELEASGTPYEIEGGGQRVLVPRESLYATRATLASSGLSGSVTPQGYELLDSQGLSVSDFRQRVDYQRALEGELSRTLAAMDGVDSATVRLVIPEEELFTEQQNPVTASVLLDTVRELSAGEVETVSFLVSSAVEGLDVANVTVADTNGTVLHAPGEAGGASVATNRNMRQTQEYEQALADDVTQLLSQVGGGPASVVVRATLNFDEQERSTERYDPDSQVAVREQTTAEEFEGAGMLPGGTVGVDGGPVAAAADGNNTYQRDEAVREFGVDKITERTITAPGRVEGLSVAIVMDDGSLTGADIPDTVTLENLVSAALGLDERRGDEIAITPVPFPVAQEAEEEPERSGLVDLITQIVAVAVLLIVGLGLFLMSRRRRSDGAIQVVEAAPALQVDETQELPAVDHDPEPVAAHDSRLRADVAELVQRQPEEIAVLLRSWLADRRA